jgi:hypothetical protein
MTSWLETISIFGLWHCTPPAVVKGRSQLDLLLECLEPAESGPGGGQREEFVEGAIIKKLVPNLVTLWLSWRQAFFVQPPKDEADGAKVLQHRHDFVEMLQFFSSSLHQTKHSIQHIKKCHSQLNWGWSNWGGESKLVSK